MTAAQLEIQLVAVVVAVACAIPGVFLVLRRMALMSDAIGHTVLLGIVLAFFIQGDLDSPLLAVGAALVGLLTALMVEMLRRTGLVREDAAIGLVFPLLFSIAVILISRYAGDVHLDTDAVLLGELAFAPFNRFELVGLDFGPRALVQMGTVLLVNVMLVALFYKELKIATFDPALAAALGLAPGVVHALLMTSVSITALGAFDAVGSILVVGLMIGPPTTAYLLTEELWGMLWLSGVIGALAAIGGYWLAFALDASIAGSIATTIGAIFAIVLALAPSHGLIAAAHRRSRLRRSLAHAILVAHLDGDARGSSVSRLGGGLGWSEQFTQRIVLGAERAGLVARLSDDLVLTPRGRSLAQRRSLHEHEYAGDETLRQAPPASG